MEKLIVRWQPLFYLLKINIRQLVVETYFGVGGQVHVDSASFRPVAPFFLEAAQEMGYKVVDDINVPFQEGKNHAPTAFHVALTLEL